MPTYTFKNNETGEEITAIMSNAERKEYLSKNPNLIQTLKSSNIVSGVGGIKVDDGFKDMLRAMKNSNPNSTIEV